MTQAPIKVVAGACLALAALTLLLPGSPTYDPWAWILWGREIVEGDLDTRNGPSWKPLPMLFTVPFALFGDAAPELWLVIARAGGFLAVAMAYRIGARIATPAAGVVAAVALTASESFVRHFWRGFSEGLLVGLVLLALDRHLEGKRAQVVWLGVAAALLRPEVWPFLALYGLWWLHQDRGRASWHLAGGALITAVSWFVPEYAGSGDFLRAATRAQQANLDSPAHAEQPWLEVLGQSSGLLLPSVMAFAVVGLVVRRRDGLVIALGVGVTALMVAVAAMTQAGFAGNLRYVALPAALVCILAGVGAARGPLLALLVAVTLPFVPGTAEALWVDARKVRSEGHLHDTLPVAIEKAGGIRRVNACGAVFTGRFEVPVVAWELHRHIGEVRIFAYPPGHAFAARWLALADDPRFEKVTETKKWVVGRRCAPPGLASPAR